jgi:hypothetical protein
VVRSLQISDDLADGPARSFGDFRVALAWRVTRHVLASERSLETPGVAVSVSGKVREDVAHCPVRQPARRSGLFV